MKTLEKIVLFLLLTLGTGSFAQDFTNEGTDFWMAYPEVKDNDAATFTIAISSRFSATGSVDIPGAAWSEPFTTTPGEVTKVVIPGAIANNENSEVIFNNAINISTDLPITVYAHTDYQYRSEATVVLPTESLGSKYMVTTYKNIKNTGGVVIWGPAGPGGGTLYRSEYIIVAGSDPCEVQITTSCDTKGGYAAGDSWIVNLNPGEAYMVQAGDDVTNNCTGSIVEATNGTDKFSVYNGHEWTWIKSPGCSDKTKDPMLEVAYPMDTWGKEHILVRTILDEENQYRVVAGTAGTEVYENGTLVTTLAAEGDAFNGFFTDEVVYITTSEPAAVIQSMITRDCDNNNGDPSMVLISPNEQMYLDTATFYATYHNEVDSCAISVVTRSTDIGMVKLNGTLLTGWTPMPADPQYSYMSMDVDTGAHTITTEGCGFLAYSYGTGWAESYFFTAGCKISTFEDSLSFSQWIGANPNFCDQDTVLFEAHTSGGPVVSYEWWFGDGNTSFEENPTHVYLTDGLFTVTLIVEYMCHWDTISDVIDIYSSPEFTGIITPEQCEGFSDGSIDVTTTGGTAPYSWEWSTSEITEDITDLSSGWYTLEVTDDKGCVKVDSFELVTPDALDITISTTDPTCNGYSDGTATVDAVTGGAGGYTYAWSSSAGTAATESGLSAGTVTVTVTDSDGCEQSEDIDLIDPTAVLVNAVDTTICINGGVELIANGAGGAGGPYTYNWTDGVLPLAGPIEYPASAGCFEVTATDVNGCTSAVTTLCYDFFAPLSGTIDSEDICPEELAELSSSISGGDGSYTYSWSNTAGVIGTDPTVSTSQDESSMEYCVIVNDGCETPPITLCSTVEMHPLPNLYPIDQADCVPFIASFSAMDDHSLIASMTWDFGDGTSVTATTPTHEYAYAGEYDVTISGTTINGCEFEEIFEGLVTGYEVPEASFSYSPSHDITVENTEVNFTNTSSGGDSYSWDFGDGSGSSAEDPSYTFPAIGNIEYTVTLTVISEYGCTDETQAHVYVDDILIYYVPNAFTPDGNSYNNDFKPVFTEGYDPYNYHLTVFNRWGEIMFESYNAENGWDGTYSNQGIAEDGVYVWQIEFSENSTGKDFVERGHITLLR